MDFSLPGGIHANSANAGEGTRPQTRRRHNLYAKVWHPFNGTWRVSHSFTLGLELDTASNGARLASGNNLSSSRPTSRGSARGGAHLPSISVAALLQLRSALAQPGALNFCCCSPRQSKAASEDEAIFRVLCEQASGLISEECCEELRALLAQRSHASGEVVVDVSADTSRIEALLKPEPGSDLMDISICALRGHAGGKPLVALTRLDDRAAVEGSAVRYAALVLCAAGFEKFSCDIGRALATTFMNDQFLDEMVKIPTCQPEAVLEAFDRYLATMTLVPTVHMTQSVEKNVDETDGPRVEQEILLADSLAEGLEKRMCHSPVRSEASTKLTHGIVLSGSDDRLGHWVHYFVEVDQFSETSKQWEVTRRLRHGFELDTTSENMRPHLPHISLDGLSRVRDLMQPASVALDVDAQNAEEAVRAIMFQLERVGLARARSGGICEAFLDRTDKGFGHVNSSSTPRAQNTELIKPVIGEEACVILAMAHSDVPAGNGVYGAFLRMAKPIDLSCSHTPLPIPTRFLLVLVGPSGADSELVSISDSLAALTMDEDLMSSLLTARDVGAFHDAVEDRLDALILLPHAHMHNTKTFSTKLNLTQAEGNSESSKEETVIQAHCEDLGDPGTWRYTLRMCIKRMQRYSIPLVTGVIVALLWNNVHEESYERFSHGIWAHGDLFGDDVPLSLHFVVNDIFMCFFFGLAIKEVTEAVLPGGSLSPISRAANPLFATIGGIVGPIAIYFALTSIMIAADAFDGTLCTVPLADGRRLGGASKPTGPMETKPCTDVMLLKGWGVPIATDISLAWMFALLIFGAGHPAINFLLLLAIVDDAIGMGIIAIFYPDPSNPVRPQYLGFVLLAMVLAGLLRILLSRVELQFWSIYVFTCGPISWFGLYKAHVHPALALVFVVPFMPATHAALRHSHTSRRLGASMTSALDQVSRVARAMPLRRRSSIVEKAYETLLKLESAPLHTFEHQLKLPVDLGMLFFGLANAGVKFESFGGITISVVVALLVGKTLGIALFALLAVALGFSLPTGVTVADLFAMGALGGIGLTVALFMSNEAFVDAGLRGQAKIGAVISVLSAGLAWLLRRLLNSCCSRSRMTACQPVMEDPECCCDEAEDDTFIDDLVVQDILEILRMKRRYTFRGTQMPIEKVARSVSKDACRHPGRRDSRAVRESESRPSSARSGRPSSGRASSALPGVPDDKEIQMRLELRLAALALQNDRPDPSVELT